MAHKVPEGIGGVGSFRSYRGPLGFGRHPTPFVAPPDTIQVPPDTIQGSADTVRVTPNKRSGPDVPDTIRMTPDTRHYTIRGPSDTVPVRHYSGDT